MSSQWRNPNSPRCRRLKVLRAIRTSTWPHERITANPHEERVHHGEDGRNPFRNHQAPLISAGDLSRRRIHDLLDMGMVTVAHRRCNALVEGSGFNPVARYPPLPKQRCKSRRDGERPLLECQIAVVEGRCRSVLFVPSPERGQVRLMTVRYSGCDCYHRFKPPGHGDVSVAQLLLRRTAGMDCPPGAVQSRRRSNSPGLLRRALCAAVERQVSSERRNSADMLAEWRIRGWSEFERCQN
jgi:hypothetical protein